MPKRASPRTHTRKELAPAPAPLGIALACIAAAVALFTGISQLLN